MTDINVSDINRSLGPVAGKSVLELKHAFIIAIIGIVFSMSALLMDAYQQKNPEIACDNGSVTIRDINLKQSRDSTIDLSSLCTKITENTFRHETLPPGYVPFESSESHPH